MSIEQEGVEGVSSVGIEDGLFRQVWSLTQFYSDDFSKVQGGEKSIFNKRTIKVCISCFDRCPRTSTPSRAHLKMSLLVCSSGSNARVKLRALEG